MTLKSWTTPRRASLNSKPPTPLQQAILDALRTIPPENWTNISAITLHLGRPPSHVSGIARATTVLVDQGLVERDTSQKPNAYRAAPQEGSTR